MLILQHFLFQKIVDNFTWKKLKSLQVELEVWINTRTACVALSLSAPFATRLAWFWKYLLNAVMSHVSTGHSVLLPSVLRKQLRTQQQMKNQQGAEKRNSHKAYSRLHQCLVVTNENHPPSYLTGNLKQQIKGGGRWDGDRHVHGNENRQRKSIRSTKPERRYINV